MKTSNHCGLVLTVVFLIILDVKEDVESLKNISKCRIRVQPSFPPPSLVIAWKIPENGCRMRPHMGLAINGIASAACA